TTSSPPGSAVKNRPEAPSLWRETLLGFVLFFEGGGEGRSLFGEDAPGHASLRSRQSLISVQGHLPDRLDEEADGLISAMRHVVRNDEFQVNRLGGVHIPGGNKIDSGAGNILANALGRLRLANRLAPLHVQREVHLISSLLPPVRGARGARRDAMST